MILAFLAYAAFGFLVPAPIGFSGFDLAQLADGMLLYDAFHRWARDATEERHTWEAHAPKWGKP